MTMTRHSRSLHIAAILAGIIGLSSQAGSAPSGIDVPLYRPLLGVEFKNSPEAGAEFLRVTPGSPAALADLQPGDKVLSIDGRAVRTMTAALEAITSHPPYDTVEILLDRNGERLTRRVVLGGKMRLDDVAITKFHPIPGVETADDMAAPGAVEALDQINVLKRVLVDTQKGTVEFIGTYDPRYATGPLPYRELLEEGLLHPEPAFTFGEPEQGMLDEADKLYAKKEADIETFSGPEARQNFALWLRRWMNLIMGHPLLENERQIYLARHAAVAGLTKSEFALISNYVTLHGAMNPVPPDILNLQLKILRNLGFEKEAGAYALYRQGTTKALSEASKALGIYEQVRKILAPIIAARKSENEMLNAIRAFVCCELMVALKQTSRAQADALWLDFEQGKVKTGGLDSSLQLRIVPEWDRAGHPLVYQAINGMPISNKLLKLFYDVKPPTIGLVFKDVPAASRLGRILYKADYVLKTIDDAEELFGNVSGHKSFRAVAGDKRFDRNIWFRYELRPLEVPLYISDNRSEVNFGEARIAVGSGAGQFPGRKAANQAEVADALSAVASYARQIEDRYDDYARAYSPLHELREAAKILALARWLQREKTVIQGGGSPSIAWTPPTRIPWLYRVSMTFEFPPEGSGRTEGIFYMPMAVEGGATFKTQKNWVVLSPKPPSYTPVAQDLATSAALGEQAVQAALGGDLESARELAELSARAMSGDIDKVRLPANIILPEEKLQRPATPEAVRLVKEAIKAVRIASSESSQGLPASRPSERASLLKDAGDALRLRKSDQPAASALLKRLQTRELAPKTSDGSRILQQENNEESSAQPGLDCAQSLSSFSEGAELGGNRKSFLEARVAEIQKKLEVVRKSMEELSRLRQGDLAALKEREAEISAAYEEAQERALDAMTMFLIDGPLEILNKRREAMEQAFDHDLTKTLLVRNVTLNAEDLARLDQKGFALFRMKNAYERIYGRAERLQNTLSGARSLSDMTGWADSDKDDYEKIKDGTLQLVEMLLGDEKVGGALKLGKLTGKSALRLLSLYRATDAAWEFFYDIMQQKYIWEPLVDELNKSLETNRRAVIALQKKSRDLQTRLNCLRNVQ